MALCDMWPETMWTTDQWPLDQWPYCVVDILPIDGCILNYCTNLISFLSISVDLLATASQSIELISRVDLPSVDLLYDLIYNVGLTTNVNLFTSLPQILIYDSYLESHVILWTDFDDISELDITLQSNVNIATDLTQTLDTDTNVESVYNIVIDLCYDGNYQSCVLT